MKQTAILTTTTLLTILLMTFHLAGDIVFKLSPAGFANLFAVFVFVVMLCGTLLLAGRRSGYIIVFFGSLFALVMPVLHMRGAHGMIGGEVGNSSQGFFFVWVLLALSVTATFSAILSACALWRNNKKAAPRGAAS